MSDPERKRDSARGKEREERDGRGMGEGKRREGGRRRAVAGG